MMLLMKYISKNCLICESTFEAPLKEHNRGYGKYCSRDCVNASIKKRRAEEVKPEPNTTCAHCSAVFYRSASKAKCSKSGFQFCNRECKEAAQKLGGIEEIMPAHYGLGNGAYDYRERAFAHYPPECADCGWNLVDDVLEVHHIDRDRTNNVVENLKILCPTCHNIEHYMTMSGKFTYRAMRCESC